MQCFDDASQALPLGQGGFIHSLQSLQYVISPGHLLSFCLIPIAWQSKSWQRLLGSCLSKTALAGQAHHLLLCCALQLLGIDPLTSLDNTLSLLGKTEAFVKEDVFDLLYCEIHEDVGRQNLLGKGARHSSIGVLVYLHDKDLHVHSTFGS